MGHLVGKRIFPGLHRGGAVHAAPVEETDGSGVGIHDRHCVEQASCGEGV